MLAILLVACFPELGDGPAPDGSSDEQDEVDEGTDERAGGDEDSGGDSTILEWNDTGLCVGYRDDDGDGYGALIEEPVPCELIGDGFAAVGGDCDDGDDAVNPGMSEACNGVDDDCDGAADSQDVCNGCAVHPGPDGRPYAFCAETSTWTKAYEACASMASYHLVTIGDATEQAFLFESAGRIVDGAWWWIGYHNMDASTGHEPDRRWEWVDGIESKYTNWGHGQPDDAGDAEDCGHFYGDDGYWNDLPCDDASYGDTPLYFVCEASP